MALTKRFLSLALALALGLALIIPTFAADEADPYAPIITKQPSGPLAMQTGNSLNLEVAATLAEGSSGTLSYAWYDYDWQPGDEAEPVAIGANVTIPIALGDTSFGINFFTYTAVVTNTYEDEGGELQTLSVVSDPIYIFLFEPYGKIVSIVWDSLINSSSILDFIKRIILLPSVVIISLPGLAIIYPILLLLSRL